MVDNFTADAGAGGETFASDDIAGVQYPIGKIALGALDTANLWSVGAGNVDTGTPRVVLASDQAVVSTNWAGTSPPIGAGVEATALRVTLATDSTGVLSVDDNGGALTVDNGGTFVVQVDGAALTALQLIDDPVATDDTTTHTAATTKVMGIGAVATPTDGSVDANDIGMPAMSLDRRLHTDTEITAALPAGTNAIGKLAANSGVDIGDVDVLTYPGPADAKFATLGQKTKAGSMPVTLASDEDTVNVANAGTFAVQVDAALPAGTNAIGKLAANSGVDIGDVDVTSISAGANLIGDVGISGARTSGGTTLYKNIDVDETEDQVKGTAGQVYWIHAINLTAAPIYLKFYNATAASVIVGTTVPDLTFPVPGNADSDGAGFTLAIPNGIAFSTAITIAGTTGVADADTGAPAANALVVNLGYA